jgi:hypothetical protein
MEGMGRNRQLLSSTSQDQAIADVAGGQHGNVTHAQLLALGLTERQIAYRIAIGRLHRVYRGVYSVGRPPKTAHEHAMAAVLACGERAALSHHSAGLTSRDFRTHERIRMTSPARTILDCAPGLTAKQLSRAVNDGRRSPQTHLRPWHLAEVIARYPYHPGAKKLKPLLDVKGGPTRSDWEDAFPAFCHQFELPEPVMSTDVAGHEVDALWPEHRVIIELDSWDFHQDRHAFESDRDRDADTLAAGYLTIRITWERIEQRSAREAARLHEILKRWGKRAG